MLHAIMMRSHGFWSVSLLNSLDGVGHLVKIEAEMSKAGWERPLPVRLATRLLALPSIGHLHAFLGSNRL